MTPKKYKQFRVLVMLFVATIVGLSTAINSYPLAAAAVVSGMLFMIFARSKTKIKVDEREKLVREKAAQYTYSIFTPVIGIGSFLMIIFGQKQIYFLALGQVLAYLTLFLIFIYTISYYFLNKKFGGN